MGCFLNSGSDFNISSVDGVHTFNIPNASGLARGLVSTTTQSFAGAKTFLDNVTVGNAPSDKLIVTAELASSLIPDIYVLYNLGSLTRRFRSGSFNNFTFNKFCIVKTQFNNLLICLSINNCLSFDISKPTR